MLQIANIIYLLFQPKIQVDQPQTKSADVPKFIQKREKYKDLYFSQSAIDKNTVHVMTGLSLINGEESANFR